VKFLDEVIIDVRSGKGGDGMVHFHRERFVPRGGPDGGDGGRGGDVILSVDEGCNTLLHLRFNPHHRAGNGQPGGTGNRNGRGGDDVVIRLPQGTTVREVDGEGVLADLTAAGQRVVIAAGGKGGRGNAAFKSSTNRTPTQAESGQPGHQLRLALELRLLADVGLVGLPNAGKSTLLSRLSAARPRVADYPFTTLEPSLGVVRADDFGSFVMADLPGLVEGAHEGRGLGHRFLRHVERTAVFLYLVSLETAGDEGDDPVERFRSVYDELRAYEPSLVERPGMVGLSKLDTLYARGELEQLTRRVQEGTGLPTVAFSSVTGEGLDELVRALSRAVNRERESRT
jgi:GTP-binding protein